MHGCKQKKKTHKYYNNNKKIFLYNFLSQQYNFLSINLRLHCCLLLTHDTQLTEDKRVLVIIGGELRTMVLHHSRIYLFHQLSRIYNKTLDRLFERLISLLTFKKHLYYYQVKQEYKILLSKQNKILSTHKIMGKRIYFIICLSIEQKIL